MEGKDLPIIEHPTHDHPLVLRESLQGAGDCYGGGSVPVYCNGCREPISSSFSSSSSSSGAEGGGGTFYVCTNSCRYFLHKRCAELPPEIEHPFHPQHALTLSLGRPLFSYFCVVCNSNSGEDGFLYSCFGCSCYIHPRCASMAAHIKDRVDENYKIHQHRLIPLEDEAQFLCYACGREHEGKSYLCLTCGFWANQICASAPTTVVLHGHRHPLTLFRTDWEMYKCKICNEVLKAGYGAYHCLEECEYSVHISCPPSEEIENPNKDFKEDISLVSWPLTNESTEIMTQLIKNLILQGRHKKATKFPRCRKNHQLSFVNMKIDKSKDDQLCTACAQTVSCQFYHCVQCNFYLHEWCADLPNNLLHTAHRDHPLHLLEHPNLMWWTRKDNEVLYANCDCCHMPTNGFVFYCFICKFYLDLKCASLPELIKHQAHAHNLILRRMINSYSCDACGEAWSSKSPPYCFQSEAFNFKLCIKCTLLPFSVRHRYDTHPFILTYSSIKGQPDDYYCEICEEDIDSRYWFYHCIECDQSLHSECIYAFERSMNMKLDACVEVNFHSHPLGRVRDPKTDAEIRCHLCDIGFTRSQNIAFECRQCNLFMHLSCVRDKERCNLLMPFKVNLMNLLKS